MDNLSYFLMLNLNTGEVSQTPVNKPNIDIFSYFNAINILNKSANVYGVVYLASDEALHSLKE